MLACVTPRSATDGNAGKPSIGILKTPWWRVRGRNGFAIEANSRGAFDPALLE